MSEGPRWKGQVEILHFNLAQITAIASSARSEIFWAFHDDVPMSANEIAKDVGKSAQTVRYHINELVKVGLLLPVEHRKSRSRTEEAYVHAGIGNYTQPGDLSPEYLEMMAKGFESMTRSMAKEREAMMQMRSVDIKLGVYQVHETWKVRLTPENAVRVAKILSKAIAEAVALDEDGGLRTHVSCYMSATIGESKRIIAASKKKRKRVLE